MQAFTTFNMWCNNVSVISNMVVHSPEIGRWARLHPRLQQVSVVKLCCCCTTSPDVSTVNVLPLFPRVVRALIYHVIELGAEVIEFSIVAKSPPLHIDTHATVTPFNQVNILHFLHVAGVGPCAWKMENVASMHVKGWQSVFILRYFMTLFYKGALRTDTALLYKVCAVCTIITRAERRLSVVFTQEVTVLNQSINQYLYKRIKSWWTFTDERTASRTGKLCLHADKDKTRSRTSYHLSRAGDQPPDNEDRTPLLLLRFPCSHGHTSEWSLECHSEPCWQRRARSDVCVKYDDISTQGLQLSQVQRHKYRADRDLSPREGGGGWRDLPTMSPTSHLGSS